MTRPSLTECVHRQTLWPAVDVTVQRERLTWSRLMLLVSLSVYLSVSTYVLSGLLSVSPPIVWNSSRSRPSGQIVASWQSSWKSFCTSQIEEMQLCESIQRRIVSFMQNMSTRSLKHSCLKYFGANLNFWVLVWIFQLDERVAEKKKKALVKLNRAIFLNALMFVLLSVFLKGSFCQQAQQEV